MGAISICIASQEPAWSPDGKKLAYSYWSKEGWRVYVMNADGTGTQALTDEEGGRLTVWHPDGKQLAFISLRYKGFRIYTIDADGKKVRDLFTYPAPLVVTIPQWSPDGKTLVFAEWDTTTKMVQVATVRDDGTDYKILTTKTGHAHARWSPDGKSLSYGRFKNDYVYFRENQTATLIVSDADGKNSRELIRNIGSAAEWKPK
ncbi:MAG: hypothetical protein L0241_07070 [Planctomycetia bacterium]|nr:hypothetical protein [Planctomycetia bacterium]